MAKQGTFQDSAWMRVNKEVNQSPDLRSHLIKSLEQTFSAKIVTFFTSFAARNVQIEDADAEMIESVLSAEHTATSLPTFQ